ncbi:DUF3108 domain-containing protein [Yeosuana sp. MJ-SS3]|uniref:DUF3108 domain-containing protein n=1 Tax=Gilvirhabdus luticola TaxID=3079858 RepID=A0ABU3U7H1_9FLAO|nr:DUF3108 domain-containing protein [Yeosuana sp. MJ-SS3]MDU8886340.1 DUF3108 domain-containing protein [Yeosuana sp. MJ-SS3]
MNRITIALIFFLSCFVNAQNNAIGTNEKLVFTASYNMSGILNNLAEVRMETSEVKTSKTTLLRLKCTASTYSKWDHFFKIRDLYESYVSPISLKPYLYKRDINEGSYYKAMKYTYDHKTNTIKTLQQKKKKDGSLWGENKTITVQSKTKDIVSTLYFIRTLDYNNMSVGKSNELIIVFDREEVKAHITYLGKETISTVLGKLPCYKLSISTNKVDVLKGTNSNIIWLTADANKIPVFATFKIAVGNGELKLKSASGLRN